MFASSTRVEIRMCLSISVRHLGMSWTNLGRKQTTLFALCQCAQSYLKGEDLSWKYEVGLAHATHYAEL